MPRKNSKRRMKGGFLEELSSSLSGWTTSLKNTTSSWSDKIKKSVPSLGASSPSAAHTPVSSTPVSSTPVSSTPVSTSAPPSSGGKKRWGGSKKMRGGYSDNTPTTGLAFNAAPFSGDTARPNTWVGGKTKKRRKHNKRSKSHRRR